MSDNEPAVEQVLPSVTRRRLTAVAGGFSLNKDSPLLPGPAADMTLADKDGAGVGGSFFLTPRFRELADWISINNAFDEGKDLPDFARQFEVYAHRLLRNPPSRATIMQFLSSPVFIQSALNADGYVVGKRPIEAATDDIYRMAHFTLKEMDHFIDDRMKQGPQSLFGTVQPEQLTPANAEKSRVFSDMAAARKAGGYPVPPHCKAGSADHYPVSGEWRSRALQEVQALPAPEIGR